MKKLILITFFTFTYAILVAQATNTDTNSAQINSKIVDTAGMAKLYFIRSTGYVGSAINLRVLVDSVMMCKVRNNRYATFYVQPGTHTFNAASWDAPKARAKLGLKMALEAGKTYYLSIRMKQRFMETEISVEEITLNTAAPQLEKYKRDECD